MGENKIGVIIGVVVAGLLALCLCGGVAGGAAYFVFARAAPADFPEPPREINIEPVDEAPVPPPPAQEPPAPDEDKVPIGSP